MSKAEQALARLRAIALPSVWVIRDATPSRIPVSEIVPGDIARIEAGDRVPADGRLIDGQHVMADESVLSGESLPDSEAACSAVRSSSAAKAISRSRGRAATARWGALR